MLLDDVIAELGATKQVEEFVALEVLASRLDLMIAQCPGAGVERGSRVDVQHVASRAELIFAEVDVLAFCVDVSELESTYTLTIGCCASTVGVDSYFE